MAQKGEPLLEVLTADFITKLQGLVNKHGSGQAVFKETLSHTSITVRNTGNTPFSKYQAIGLGQAAINYTNNDHRLNKIVYDCFPLDENYNKDNWAILLEPLPGKADTEAEALLAGVSWVKTEDALSSTTNKYLKVVGDHLEFADSGKALALYSYYDGELYNTLCIIGPGGSSSVELTTYILTADVALSVASSDIGDIHFGPDSIKAFTGAKGLAVKIAGQYYNISVETPADKIITLNENLPGSSTASFKTSPTPAVISSYPATHNKSQTSPVGNPLKLCSMEDDLGIIKFNYTTGLYYLAEVLPIKQKFFWAKLSENKPLGLQQTVGITPLKPLTHGDYPDTPRQAVDLFDRALNGKTNDKCLIAYDPDSNNYKIIECDHLTTHWHGQMYENWSGAPTTFKVDFLKSYNGRDPSPTTAIVVQNRWKWEAATITDKVDILYDPVTGEWYPMVKQCTSNVTAVYL